MSPEVRAKQEQAAYLEQIQIFFNERPVPELYANLKGRGFRWPPQLVLAHPRGARVEGNIMKFYYMNGNKKVYLTLNRAAPEWCNLDCPFRFIDLFAGIGGMHIGLEKAGGECVFSCEWDKYAQKTYSAWFGICPHGDIRKIEPEDIPDHNILAAGFPCQPFSIAGVSKKQSLGRLHGFQDEKQGNLFFFIAKIAEVKRPEVLILENVKNLLSHDKGNTWKVIKSTLEALDYKVFHKIIDARDYVPQHRERIFIVAFDKKVFGEDIPFDYPTPPEGRKPMMSDILEKNCDSRYTLSDHLWKYLQKYAKKHQEKGNGFGFGMASPKSVSRTLSARYYKDGSEILISQKGKNPRRLTPRECAKLMGFPKELPIVVSDTQAYRQFGNALVPPIAESVARQVVKVFQWAEKTKKITLKKPGACRPAQLVPR